MVLNDFENFNCLYWFGYVLGVKRFSGVFNGVWDVVDKVIVVEFVIWFFLEFVEGMFCRVIWDYVFEFVEVYDEFMNREVFVWFFEEIIVEILNLFVIFGWDVWVLVVVEVEFGWVYVVGIMFGIFFGVNVYVSFDMGVKSLGGINMVEVDNVLDVI